MIDQQFLHHLSKDYPNIDAASAEIINLTAILALPKGTEYFLSDIHGEHEAFIHMLKSASGVIRSKIDELFSNQMTEEQRYNLASLVYNAEAELKRSKLREKNFDKWCKTTIYYLVDICKSVSTKYTRSKVRKRLPVHSAYSMDELLHSDDAANKAHYYSQIINSIIDCRVAEKFIIELTEAIHSLAVDRLHIIGDIWDRGAHPDDIMDFLMNYHDVDFQWGNHDIVWMGAATGNWACITNVVRMNISYNNFDMMEIGYGINLRPLAIFASKVYADDSCEYFKPKILDENEYDPIDEDLAAKMNKAIAICQFKVEGQRIKAHPEYKLDNRLLLDKVDYKNGTITLKGVKYTLRDNNFPTINPLDPYTLTKEEKDVLNSLEASFLQSEKLQKHIRFLYSHGAMYKCVNGNLLYHGCIPMTDDGEFKPCTVNGATHKGRAYMDYLDQQVRKAYFTPAESEETGRSGDLMWYLWLGSNSPLFGKDQMTTFERCFIADKKSHKELTVPYYKLIHDKAICEKILAEFGLYGKSCHILNGHVPVKIKDGESPIRGSGKLIIIDGGISKAYQKQTGIAGYTFIFNSRFMALSEHKPYEPLRDDGTQTFHDPHLRTVETLQKRMLVGDSDQAKELRQEVEQLKALLEAYRTGNIKETF
ncbi:MAG: fructose-1,6-bisphosphatase [Anaerovoracaceae bacterium]